MQQKLIINRLYSVVCILSSALCLRSSTSVKDPLQIDLFMQNKPNVKYAQINVNSYMKSIYEKLDTWLSGKYKPNSNPIQTQFKPNSNPVLSAVEWANFFKGQNERKLI